jgi:hypothetical protein
MGVPNKMNQDQQVEILCSCLSNVMPAAKAYGSNLRDRIKNVEETASTFCILVQVCARTDQHLMTNEMILEGTECLTWLKEKLLSWDKTPTIKILCDSITVLEGMHADAIYPIKFINKYPRIRQQEPQLTSKLDVLYNTHIRH